MRSHRGPHGLDGKLTIIRRKAEGTNACAFERTHTTADLQGFEVLAEGNVWAWVPHQRC